METMEMNIKINKQITELFKLLNIPITPKIKWYIRSIISNQINYHNYMTEDVTWKLENSITPKLQKMLQNNDERQNT